MKKFSEMFRNWIVRNLVLAVAFVLGITFFVSILLSIITQHSTIIEVPDFKNMTYLEAVECASKAGVRVFVSDSAYVRSLRPGAVFGQNPKAGSAVKKGRRVLLTTNALSPKMVSMPSLVGCSIRQARAELASKGLVLGRFTYVSDIATNNVLRQLFRGVDIEPGEKIVAGSRVNLVLGLNDEDGTSYVPGVVGQRCQKAIEILQDNSLNVGNLIFEKRMDSFVDSLSCVVWKQSPEPSEYPVSIGSAVTLYLKSE